MTEHALRVLQVCHGYGGPFLDCARQYTALFEGTPWQVTTVYLVGDEDEAVRRATGGDQVRFLGYQSRNLRGLKLRVVNDLRHILREQPVNFCLAQRFKSIYSCLLASELPVIGVHHAFGDYRRHSRRLFAWAFRKRLALLGISDAIRDELRADLPQWPEWQIETLYNRINIAQVQAELIPRTLARRALDLPDNAWVIGNVGRLHPDKDQTTLIRAFARALPKLPESSLLVILGSGRLEQKLKALCAELGVVERVRFAGQVTQARRLFTAFDLFALSSDHEPFGMVLLEAMAAGVPLICTASGGGQEVVRDVGQLVPLADPEALATALIQAVGMTPPQAALADKLAREFSYQAAHTRFWQLDMVRRLVEDVA